MKKKLYMKPQSAAYLSELSSIIAISDPKVTVDTVEESNPEDFEGKKFGDWNIWE